MQLTLRLPRTDPSEQIEASQGRREPVVWVRRVMVLDELAPGREHVVRDIKFRRGLNIVWAPSLESEGDNELFGDGIAGHTAGKTTLCRLVRHALGEASFAPEVTRRRIRLAFPAGWLLAEVVVAGRLWSVGRPLGIGRSSFCVCDHGLADALAGQDRVDYQAFIDAIDAASTSALPARKFPGRPGVVAWEHVLPWVTRDQECRFADFMEWRHPSSDSQAPALTADERQFMVRSLLSLITDEERQEQRHNAALVNEKATASARAPLLAHQASVDHGRAERILGMELPAPSDDLFGQQARREIDTRRVDLASRQSVLDAEDQRGALQERLEDSVAEEARARWDLEEANQRLAMERSALEQLDPQHSDDGQGDLFAELPPPRGYCNVPMELARRRGCPMATTRPYELEEQRAKKTAEQDLDDLRMVVRALEEKVESCRASLGAAQARSIDARAALLRHSATFRERLSILLREQAAFDQAERLVANAEDASRDSDRLTRSISALDEQIKDSYTRQEQLRHATSEALGRFSARFDYIVRALVGDDVVAKVEASGRSLRLVADEHGERESAAFGTVKLLAFDLAALTESIEGRGSHPRFLMHDGPREADMAEDIYERLFLYARRLEECFSGEPSFQYIITTTSAPPMELRDDPWLMLELRGAPEARRLLGRNL